MANFIQYKCSWCGAVQTKPINGGRPNPGKCPRKEGNKPHAWVINRKL